MTEDQIPPIDWEAMGAAIRRGRDCGVTLSNSIRAARKARFASRAGERRYWRMQARVQRQNGMRGLGIAA